MVIFAAFVALSVIICVITVAPLTLYDVITHIISDCNNIWLHYTQSILRYTFNRQSIELVCEKMRSVNVQPLTLNHAKFISKSRIVKHILRMTIVTVATGDVVSTSVWMDLDFHCSIHTTIEYNILFLRRTARGARNHKGLIQPMLILNHCLCKFF